MLLRQLFDRETSTYTYLLADETTGEAALIDPVLEQVDRELKLLSELGLELFYVLETRVTNMRGGMLACDRSGLPVERDRRTG